VQIPLPEAMGGHASRLASESRLTLFPDRQRA
jgi:hypothetical protein